MSHTHRHSLTAAEREALWERWKRGDSVAAIARALGRTPSGVAHVLARSGGIAPAPRKRRSNALSLAEREVISRGIAANL